jgi:hypothetical protein
MITSTADDASGLSQPSTSALQHSIAIIFTAQFFGGSLITFIHRAH